MEEYIRSKLSDDLSQTTLVKRVRWLVRLSELFEDSKDFSFLNQTDKVIAFIKKTDNVGSQWTYLTNVLQAIKSDPNLISHEAKLKYAALQETLAERRSNMVNARKPVVNREKDLNYYQSQIREKIQKLFADAGLPYKPLTAQDLRKIDYRFAYNLQRLVVISCYLLQPALRNDWGALKISHKFKGLPTDANYIYVRGNWKLILSQYKNSKSLGQQIIPIRDELRDLLKIWIGVVKYFTKEQVDYLLQYTITKDKFDHISSEDALRRIISTRSNELFGEKLTINDYRHMWEESFIHDPAYTGLSRLERIELHRQMLHSPETAMLYYS